MELKMSAPLRVGVIGLGARCVIAENCHKATIPAELVGGCDPNPAMRQRATEVWAITRGLKPLMSCWNWELIVQL